MFKSLASAALLPIAVVLGRGQNTGLNQANAQTVELLNEDAFVLTLHVYNAINDNTLEFHGDVELAIKPGFDTSSFQEYGWCLEFEVGVWECMIL